MDHGDGWTAGRTPSRSGRSGSGEAGAATRPTGTDGWRRKEGPSSRGLGLPVVQTQQEPGQFSAQSGKGGLRSRRLSEDHQASGCRRWKMSADVAQAPPKLVAKDGGSEGFAQNEDGPQGRRLTAANPEKGALRPRHRTRRPVAARSDGQTLAAPPPTTRQNGPSGGGAHALSKAMLVPAPPPARLIGSLQKGQKPWEREVVAGSGLRPSSWLKLGFPSGSVNCTGRIRGRPTDSISDTGGSLTHP